MISDEAARAMYAGGRANRSARRFARVWGYVFASGIGPRRWVRPRGACVPHGADPAHPDRARSRARPLGMPCRCSASATGCATFVRTPTGRCCDTARRRPACWSKSRSTNRPVILRRYLEVAPGGRPHIPATAASSATDLVTIADAFPVFAIQRADGRPYCPTRSWFPVAAIARRRVRVRRMRVESTMEGRSEEGDPFLFCPEGPLRHHHCSADAIPDDRWPRRPQTSSAYAEALATIYPVAYKLKFRSKRQLDRDYIVAPLEALWWSGDMAAFTSARDKDQWDWTVMLLVPDWLDVSDVDAARAGGRSKRFSSLRRSTPR